MKLNKGAVLRLMEAQGTLLTAKQLRGLLGLKKSQSPKLKAWLRKQVEKGALVQQGVRFGSTRLLEHASDGQNLPQPPFVKGGRWRSPRNQIKHRAPSTSHLAPRTENRAPNLRQTGLAGIRRRKGRQCLWSRIRRVRHFSALCAVADGTVPAGEPCHQARCQAWCA